MLKFILRLFPYVQGLERSVAQASADLMGQTTLAKELETSLAHCRLELAQARALLAKSEADAEYWRHRSDVLDGKLDTAVAETRNSVEVVADWVALSRFGRTIYGKAPALPERRPEEMKPIPKHRVQARAVVQEQERQYARDMQARWESELKDLQAKKGTVSPGAYADMNEPKPPVQ